MKTFLQITLVLIAWTTFAQEDLPLNVMINLYQGEGAGAVSAIEQQFGRKAISIDDNLKIKNYKGSPLLLDKWAHAGILFTDGRLVKIPYANYDAVNDNFMIYFKGLKEPVEGVATPEFPLAGMKTESVVAISLKNDYDGLHRFIKVNPQRFSNQPKTIFFEYYSERPKDAAILKSVYKKISPNRLKGMPYSDSPEDYEFKTYSSFYLKNKDKVFVPVRLSKKGVLKAIDDKQNEKALKKFIKKQKLKMSNPKDVQTLMDYYFKTYS